MRETWKEKRAFRKRKSFCRAGAFCAFALGISVLVSGCGKKTVDSGKGIKLSVWAEESTHELLEKKIKEFQKEHKGEADIDVTISSESEETCKNSVLENQEGAADLFIFADDQFGDLYRGNALLEITDEPEKIIASVGGEDSPAAKTSMRNGKLYAIPQSSGNGYYMYYDKSYFSENDVKDMDKMLQIAGEHKKKVSMDLSSGWYLFSFFKGAGLTLESNEDGTKNICDWNTTEGKYTGKDVTEAILDIVKQDGFLSCNDDGFIKGMKAHSIIAGVNGPWNASKVKEILGDNYGAVKLPEYTLKGDKVQMCSFSGYKLMGINAHTKQKKWAMMLAKALTSKEVQLERFRLTGESPADVEAAASEEVISSPAMVALNEQAPYSYVQNITDTYWDPSALFGTILASGNADGRDLQELLEEVVQHITE